ncbi:ATP-binding protein [Patescibacteria group bacterium]|nr:ATP-binding protein [Patescibacteria group bacterium]
MLDVSQELFKVHETYLQTARNKSFNALVYGKPGSGKTYSLRTARKPVLVHSFDPGGSKTNREIVDGSSFAVDARFESRNLKPAEICDLWISEVDRLADNGMLDSLGTWAIDSFSTWINVLMSKVMTIPLPKGQRTYPGVPAMSDYQILGVRVREIITRSCSFGCDFILIAHVQSEMDQVTGGIDNTLASFPSLRTLLPTLFDEIYYARATAGSKGTEYQFQLANDGLFTACSRLAASGKLQAREPQDFLALRRKVGLE